MSEVDLHGAANGTNRDDDHRIWIRKSACGDNVLPGNTYSRIAAVHHRSLATDKRSLGALTLIPLEEVNHAVCEVSKDAGDRTAF